MSQLVTGLDLMRRGEYFAAHEELEDAWRAAEPDERGFYQGLVHVAVAWYQAGPVLPPSALTGSAGAALLAFGVLLWVVFASRRRQVGPMHAT